MCCCDAEAETPDRKRIDGADHALRMHRGAKTSGRDAVPHADLDQPAPARGMTRQTVALGLVVCVVADARPAFQAM